MPVVSVALLSPPFTTLSYSVPSYFPPDYWQEGMRVAVPLGRGLRVGVVLQQHSRPPEDVELKDVLWPLEHTPLLSATYLEMVRQLAMRYMLEPGEVLGSFLPAGLRTTQIRVKFFANGRPRIYKMRAVAALPDTERMLLAEGWMRGNAAVLDADFDADMLELCTVTQDPPWPVRPSAKRQMEVLEVLWEKGRCSRRQLIKELGAAYSAPLHTLAEKGLVHIGPQEDAACGVCQLELSTGGNVVATAGQKGSAGVPDCTSEEFLGSPPFTLTDAQQAALTSFSAGLDSNKAETRLLFGITGSGKTAVYLESIAACLRRGKSVLLLAPEVALACKLDRHVRERFPRVDVFCYHGYQSPAERERTFRTLAQRKEPCIITGTRSALFLPVPALGAILLDEEHDASFKQDEGLVYQAKEVAHYRVGQAAGLLVLGSATPDVKTYHAVEQGLFPAAVLEERVGGGSLPHVELVDIKGLNSTDSILAPQSLQLLQQTVAAGNQAVILLNRRGYAPLMYCLDCGEVARCPHCEIGLTYHKSRERLICHYCGYAVPYPVTCSKCKGLHYLPMGEGTEKLEEELAHMLPAGGGVLRLDRDSTRRPGRMEAILDAFARREAQVLVGTQMLSKGHHFPDVTLAVIADGDLGLNVPDYRAAERTFQLLVQASGRSGRGEKAGHVLIQTRDPNHYCWDYIKQADYTGFFAHEIALRKKRRYPPFMKLALVRISFPMEWKEGVGKLNELTTLVRDEGRKAQVMVLGPAPAPMPLIRGRRRFQCLLKANDWVSIRTVFGRLRRAVPRTAPFRVSLDLDPVTMS